MSSSRMASASFSLAEGRLVNLASRHRPSELCDERIVCQPNVGGRSELLTNTAKYPVGVHLLPKHLDEKVARFQLKKLSAELTLLSERQARYIGVEQAGPYKADHYRY